MRGFSDPHFVMRTKDEVETVSLFSHNLSIFFFNIGCPFPGFFSPCGVSRHHPEEETEKKLGVNDMSIHQRGAAIVKKTVFINMYAEIKSSFYIVSSWWLKVLK